MKQIILFSFFVLGMLNCANNKAHISPVHIELDSDVYSRYLSITPIQTDTSDDNYILIYNDETTLSLKRTQVNNNEVTTRFIDRVDISDRLNPIMGKHFYSIEDDEEQLIYLDYQTDKKKIMKKLTKKINEISYTINTIDAEINDFSIAINQPQIIATQENNLQFGILKENNYQEILSKIPPKKFANFSLVSTSQYLSLISESPDHNLFLARYTFDNDEIKEISSKLIANRILHFHATTKDNQERIIFYDDSSLVASYEQNKIQKIGYYTQVSKVFTGTYHNLDFHLISAVDSVKNNSLHYTLYMVYSTNGQKWREISILNSDMAFTALDTAIINNKLFIASSSAIISVSQIPLVQLLGH